nr:basic salivary proline-rich protein 3-like [Loxodonta africana]
MVELQALLQVVEEVRLEQGGPPNQGACRGGVLLLWLGDPGTVSAPPPDCRARRAPPPLSARGKSAPPSARLVHESARLGAGARPGRTRARWRPHGGHRLGPSSRCWERQAAAPKQCQSGTRCPRPGPGWSPRTPVPWLQPPVRLAWTRGNHPPTPGPTRARQLQRPGDSPCPPPAPRGPGCPPALLPRPLGLESPSPQANPPSLGSLRLHPSWLRGRSFPHPVFRPCGPSPQLSPSLILIPPLRPLKPSYQPPVPVLASTSPS